ncbi:TetR/AcrR family transcriptional regulator [Streptomyces sp. NPDC003860]
MPEITEVDEGPTALNALGDALAQAGAKSISGQREELAAGLLKASLKQWEDPAVRPQLLADLTAAITDEAGAERMRAFMSAQSSHIFSQLGKALGLSHSLDIHEVAEILKVPPLNINAAQAQVWGMVILRYILRLEPISTASSEEIVELLAPTIQRYLVG